MSIYKITEVVTHNTHADSREEALELWLGGSLDAPHIVTTVEEIDPIFSGGVSQLETSDSKNEEIATECEDCGKNFYEGGYHRNDEVKITFSTLKHAQNQAILEGIRYAMDYLEDINYHDGANAVAEFIDIINGKATAPEWQSEFLKRHALYSTECE